MRYIDTSIVVSVLVSETTTTIATNWLASQPSNSLACSPWMLVELNASLSRKRRMQRLTEEDHELAAETFKTMVLPSLNMLPIDTAAYVNAAAICENHHAGIRTGDALHLAIATLNHIPVATLDRQFASGAATLGYAVELIA
jgi:predicted nucleic acid-binding protein